jgi:hypothetical protein
MAPNHDHATLVLWNHLRLLLVKKSLNLLQSDESLNQLLLQKVVVNLKRETRKSLEWYFFRETLCDILLRYGMTLNRSF